LSCSDRGRLLLGLAEIPSSLETFLGGLEPGESDIADEKLRALAEHGGTIDMQCRRRAPDGPHRATIRLRAAAIPCVEASSWHIVGIIAEAAPDDDLWEIRGRLAAIVQSSDDAIISKTLDGIVTSWNRGAERIFGYTQSEMLGHPIAVLAPPGLEDDMPKILEKIRRGERVEHYQTIRRHKNGSMLNISMTVSPIHDVQGRLIGASKVARDVTVAAKSREEIVEREAHLRSILATVPDGMIIIDERGQIESFSAAAERLFGYSAAEVRGKNVSVLMPSPDREAHDGYLERYLTTGERNIIGVGRRLIGRRKDGARFPFYLTVGEVARRGRRVFTGFTHDLTEREGADARLRDLQDELLHMSRLNAMGQLAAMLAHELNQPLTAVINYAEAARLLLAASSEPVPRALDLMQKTAAQAERAGQIIRRLRSFVQKRPAERSEEQLSIVVEEAASLAATGTHVDGIEVIYDLSNSLPVILIDRTQIQQVVVNLVRNATDVLREAQNRRLTIQTSLAEDNFQEVAIHDTGPGIPTEMIDQLFKPFVTTKSDGMGVGLSICQSIVEAHGGRLWVESNPAGGAVFRFRLPQMRTEEDNS
jgi:two-component system sensor kinase FixL